ncbi:hypothetical protein COY32_05440, partial [candidate division WWE3 bacterium CG_4_10_14_0_2_um_filter_41_14]
MLRRKVVLVLLGVLLTVFAHRVSKANGFEIQWPIDNPVFTRTIVWNSETSSWGHTGVDTHGLDSQGKSLQHVPVKAVLGGTVTKVYKDSYCATVITNCGVLLSGGWMVVIDHGDGWESRYAHLKEGSILVDADPATEVKTQVSVGEQIATSGNTGFYKDPASSLPYHLHFELRHNGVIVNPCDYLVGIMGGCGVDGTIPTSVPTSISVVTATPIPTATSTPDPTANDHNP